MAEGDDNDRSSEDLGEEVSQHRLEEYRQKGQVSQSRELTSLAGLLAAGVAIHAFSPSIGKQLTEFMTEIFSANLSPRIELGSGDHLHQLLVHTLRVAVATGLPICLVGFIVSVIGSFAQIGSIWSFEPLTPSFEKIDPLSGARRLLSTRNAIESLRMLLKLIVLSVVAYGLLKSEILRAGEWAASEPIAILYGCGQVAKAIFLSLIAVLALFAVIDFVLQKHEYNKQLRLTRQEAKEEQKQQSGDPRIKARIRAVQRELARRRMKQAVKKATVIVTNPTHFAVALYYEPGTTAAPKVVAKGADFIAQRIKMIAAEAGVPCVENVPLARALYKSVKVGHSVPRALYEAVAEVLAYVYRLKGGKF